MHVKIIKKNARRSYKKGGVRKPVKRQNGGGSALLDAVQAGAIEPGTYTDPNVIAAQNAAANAAANPTDPAVTAEMQQTAATTPQLMQSIQPNNVVQQGIQAPGANVAEQLGIKQGLGEKLRLGAEGAGMQLAGAGQNAIGSLKEGLKSGKIGLSGAGAALGAGATALINKQSGTRNDPYRTDKTQRTGAAVGGALAGAGKGFDLGNKIIPGLGGVIGAAGGALAGAFTSRKAQEKLRKSNVRGLRETQNMQMKSSANRPDQFSAKAGVGFNTATSGTKAYDQASRAQKGGIRNEAVADPEVGKKIADQSDWRETTFFDKIRAHYYSDPYLSERFGGTGAVNAQKKQEFRNYRAALDKWEAGGKKGDKPKMPKWVQPLAQPGALRANWDAEYGGQDWYEKEKELGKLHWEERKKNAWKAPWADKKQAGGVRKLKGGNMSQLPGGAVQFNGASHDQGGIMLDRMTEVEGGETMDKVTMKKQGGKAKDYIFSDYLKLGGKTFARRHKEILQNGGSQQKIQELAKLQEKKAGRTPKVMQEGGPRIDDLLGGLGGYGTTDSGLSGEEELNRAATEAANVGTREAHEAQVAENERIRAENAAKREAAATKGAVEEVDAQTGQVIYAKNTAANTSENIGNWLAERESEMLNLPEEHQNSAMFDKYKDAEGNFDTTKFESDEARKEFVDWHDNLPDHLVSGKFAEEGTKGRYEFGDQWNTRRILQEEADPSTLPTYREVNLDVNIPPEVPGPKTPETPPGETPNIKKRDVPLGAWLAGGAQLIPPAYALLKKPTNVPGYAPQAYAKPQLPRVNYNAERSANASDMRATMASIENNAAGPAGMVNMIAAMGKKRQGDLQIAQAESNANKQLAAEEAQLGAQTSQFNIGQDAQAQTFNRGLAREQIKDRREEVLGALDAAAERVAGITGDVLDYKGQERMAEAISGDTGTLLREELKGQINPNTGDPYTQLEIAQIIADLKAREGGHRRGGYIKGRRLVKTKK